MWCDVISWSDLTSAHIRRSTSQWLILLSRDNLQSRQMWWSESVGLEHNRNMHQNCLLPNWLSQPPYCYTYEFIKPLFNGTISKPHLLGLLYSIQGSSCCWTFMATNIWWAGAFILHPASKSAFKNLVLSWHRLEHKLDLGVLWTRKSGSRTAQRCSQSWNHMEKEVLTEAFDWCDDVRVPLLQFYLCQN